MHAGTNRQTTKLTSGKPATGNVSAVEIDRRPPETGNHVRDAALVRAEYRIPGALGTTLRERLRRGVVAALMVVSACAPHRPGPVAEAVPGHLLGSFLDDYGAEYRITATEWSQLPRARYQIVRWNLAHQYAIARNDPANPADGGRWTRIDWLELPDSAPYTWAFCYSTYDAPTAAVAETVRVANRSTPRTGCNGFPFSRMRRPDSPPPQAPPLRGHRPDKD